MDATASTLSRPLFRQYSILAGLGLFFLLVTVMYFLKVHGDEVRTRTALIRWQAQLEKMGDGEDIWATHVYPNPPIMALILKPLAEMPAIAASLTWFVLKVLMALLCFRWVLTMLDRPEQPFPLWAQCLTIFLALRPIQSDLMHGNVNIFILFLVVGSLYAFCQGRDLLAGVVLALAIACKVTPALFVPYFIWKRSWHVLLGCLLGLGLFFFVVPALFLGWDRNTQVLSSWVDNMILPYVNKGTITSEHNNQSLPGLAIRMLTNTASFTKYVNDQKVDVEFHNVAELSHATVKWGVKACMGLFALLVVWSCRTPTVERTNWRLWAEFSLIVLGMLLFSERTWKHHCVTLLLPFAVASYVLATHWHDRTLRWLLIGCVTLATLLIASTATGLFDNHDRFGKLAQTYGAYVWANFLLVAAMVMVLKWPDPRSAVSRPQ